MLNLILDWLFVSDTSSLPSIHGGHDGDSGLLSLVDQLLDTLISGLEGGWSLFPGISILGLNFHPLLVHFPIALLSSFILIDVLGALFRRSGWRHFASQLLSLGAVLSIPTVIAGLYAAHVVPHGAQSHAIMEHHERAGIAIASIASFLAIWRAFGGLPRDTMAKTFSGLLTFLLTGALLLGADLGADLVYGHGVAVKAISTVEDQANHDHEGNRPIKP
jgi:uncharacterized membrane protein